MSDRSNLIYRYDGSFEGLMCCVFESYMRREVPSDIITTNEEQLSFYDTFDIETVPGHAERVLSAIPVRISPQAPDFIRKGFFSCNPNKDMLILKFLYLGFKHGSRVLNMLADDTVNELFKAYNYVTREAHRIRGFVRFSDFNGALVSVIEPENVVLPIIASHFIDRYRNESFMIYDKRHGMALTYCSYHAEIIEIEELELPAVSDEEKKYRDLWKTFYNSVSIRERANPRLRMNNMPKRYWRYLTEFMGA